MSNQHDRNWAKIFGHTMTLVAIMLIGIVIQTILILQYPYPLFEIKTERIVFDEGQGKADATEEPEAVTDYFAQDFDVSKLGNSMEEEYIKYGYELIAETYKHIGPENGDPSKVYSGNNLACKNCHLDAGTKKHAAPYIGVTGRYPNFRGRENKIGSIEERINGCMERSMNGKSLPSNSKEMRAMVAYMNWLSKGVPSGEKIEGKGFASLQIPERAVDLANGEKVYNEKCVSCHQLDGQGMRNNDKPGSGYAFPPLWGKDSYNHGAGMNRVITAAQFLKGNMPLGATSENPMLTDEEAYDVAGYIDSKDRPVKSGTDKDYPDLKYKPVSSPYAPWDDAFSAEQHKYGPFQPIMAYYKETYGIKKTK
jgi:thiosulfate dehydrogenase